MDNEFSEKYNIGIIGENIVRSYLKKLKFKFFQADLIFNDGSKWYVAEVKHQDKFLAPPFDGHGLPEWQLNARINFCKEFNYKISPLLIIVDKADKCLYLQDMRKLMTSNHYKTKGKSPRIIFPLTSFKKITI